MARFTDLGIERLKTTGKRYTVTEGDGLYLEVSPKGKKRWLHRYELSGQRKWFPLGEFPAMKLKDARAENARLQKLTQDGGNPAEERAALKAAPTVQELFEEWHTRGTDKRGKPWSDGHKRNVQYMFGADVLPAIGSKKVADVTKRDLRVLLERIEARAPNQALQVYRRLSRLFNYACQKDVIEHSPMTHLEPIGSTSRKSRYLSEREIGEFLAALPLMNAAPQTTRILELILRTGQRPSEVCGAHEAEIDTEGMWWTLPGSRVKNGSEHRIPLTGKMLDLFGLPNEHGLFFPSLRKEDTPVGHTILSKALRRSITGREKGTDSERTLPLEDFSPHDLRRTCATGLAELGFTDEVIGAVLNHSRRGVTAQHYNHFRYDAQKRKALEAWERRLDRIAGKEEAGNVVSLSGRRRA
ncbi:site-specific recombinase XerD [Desulfobotulus alkaliphilus]|uniref:Site-specific recombinase XerD n=1 Tax=Desulfobotulus alkaliphilus TaxID=622671 RepID=A0A562SA22_9BACT|nr:site-specific integrase [Desulfobotulus alkaliphilus]TWI77366.1 site-specific recombinase XerD [Desulfobotulus alkaliphilus]